MHAEIDAFGRMKLIIGFIYINTSQSCDAGTAQASAINNATCLQGKTGFNFSVGGGEVDVFDFDFIGGEALVFFYGDHLGIERDVAPGGDEGGFVGLEEGCVGRERGREGRRDGGSERSTSSISTL